VQVAEIGLAGHLMQKEEYAEVLMTVQDICLVIAMHGTGTHW
jgi:hypothetical protein